jgi:6,7-dimethyl-8-ribityllumazine synthase
MKIAIIAAEFNRSIVEVMIDAAIDEAKKHSVTVPQCVRVPGTYEIPLPLSRFLPRRDIDAVVVLGYIEKGDTQHGEVMGYVVHQACVELSIQHQKPVGIGIIGPGATAAQAETRKDSYARAAMRAAVSGIVTLRATRKPAKKR